MATTIEDVEFFREHAGICYHPDREGPEVGTLRNALRLADAEREAQDLGWSIRWVVDEDPMWDDDVERETTDYDQWGAVLEDDTGEHMGSLWSIDFGPDSGPSTDPYARVVAAELALEHLPAWVWS